MYSQNSAMSRRSGQSLVAIIGAFVVITILSYYSWSLSSENTALKGTIVMSYSKLKDMTTHKASLEKKNLLLSNRMVEMEDARDTEKQNAEIEQVQRKKCQAKLSKSKDECSVKVVKKQEMLARCEDGSVQRESFLMEALNDVQLESLDHAAQADIVLAKIKHLKSQLKTTKHDYVALQNKFSDLEKEKINLQEANEKITADNRKQKEFSTKSENSNENPSSQPKNNAEAKKSKDKQKETGLKRKNRMHKTKQIKKKTNAKSGPKVTNSLKPESQQTKISLETQGQATVPSGKISNSNDANNATQLKNAQGTETPVTDTSKVNKDSTERKDVSVGNYNAAKTIPSEDDDVSRNISEEAEPSYDESDEDKKKTNLKKNAARNKDSTESKDASAGNYKAPKTIQSEDDDASKGISEEAEPSDDVADEDKQMTNTKKNSDGSTSKKVAVVVDKKTDKKEGIEHEPTRKEADNERLDEGENNGKEEENDVVKSDGLNNLSAKYGQYNMENRELPKDESATEEHDTLQDLNAENINQE